MPSLSVVLVGDDEASQVYVRNKSRQTEEAGMISATHRLAAETLEGELLDLIPGLNVDKTIHGILVQLPLPDPIDEAKVIAAIDPGKDVAGFHTTNVGRLWTGPDAPVPCSAVSTSSASRWRRCCWPSTAPSLSPIRVRRTWLSAAARPISWSPPWTGRKWSGATGSSPAQRLLTRLVGDVAFDDAKTVAGFITPVPGGVGPMTIANLLRNTVIAACRQNGPPDPAL